MPMSAIVTTPPGEQSPLTFLFPSLAPLNAVLTPAALMIAIPSQLSDNPRISGPGATPANWSGPMQPTLILWANMVVSPASNIDPAQVKSVIAGALVGGGLTGYITAGGDPQLMATGVADRIYRASPPFAATLASQIVLAAVAAG